MQAFARLILSGLIQSGAANHRPIAQRVSSMKRMRKGLKETMLVSTILCAIVFPRVFLVGVVVIVLIHILAN